jgi:hypothetical protein
MVPWSRREAEFIMKAQNVKGDGGWAWVAYEQLQVFHSVCRRRGTGPNPECPWLLTYFRQTRTNAVNPKTPRAT